jgi:hypothetical protein
MVIKINTNKDTGTIPLIMEFTFLDSMDTNTVCRPSIINGVINKNIPKNDGIANLAISGNEDFLLPVLLIIAPPR